MTWLLIRQREKTQFIHEDDRQVIPSGVKLHSVLQIAGRPTDNMTGQS